MNIYEMTREQFMRRHLHCTPDLDCLRAAEAMDKEKKLEVERSQNGTPTGWAKLPGGTRKIIKGTCQHPEDGVCGFEPIPREVLLVLLNGSPEEARDSILDAPEEPDLEVILDESPAQEDADDEPIPCCPSCGMPGEVKMSDDRLYMTCTECGHKGTVESFLDPQEDDEFPPNIIAESVPVPAAVPAIPDDEPQESDDVAALRRQFLALFE